MKNQKLFIVRKYVWAKDAQEALQKERKQSADDCWVDEEFKKNLCNPVDAIGFKHNK